MDFSKNNGEKQKKWLGRSVRWTIGLIVLFFVFKNIDFVKFKQSLVGANPWLIVFGLAHSPVLILIAAFRWRFLLVQYHHEGLSFGFCLKHYWIGLSLGFFTPASLGLDAYRVVVSGRHYGEYSRNTAIILVEKLMALITCMLIIVILFPFIPIRLNPTITSIYQFAYMLLIVSGMIVAAGVFVLRNRTTSMLLNKLEGYLSRVLENLKTKLGLSESKPTTISLSALIGPLANPWIIGVIIASFGIQLVSSIKSQVFFCALGYDIPFIVNLFVAPALYFIFMLPISFGSIGIREGVYVVIYGMFGVPVEIALLVSFFNLFGMLLNNLIGGGILGLSKTGLRAHAKIDSQR